MEAIHKHIKIDKYINNVVEKKKKEIQCVLKKLLFKTVIVFTSVYFESYCKIPAWSNKSIL